MKVITATEEVFNEHGDIIKIIYHYEDETKTEKSVFIPRKEEELDLFGRTPDDPRYNDMNYDINGDYVGQ